jgi:outer membrane murein-binding lipoprotein Lpp
MNLTRGRTVTLTVAALLVVAVVAGSLAIYFAEQVSSLNAQVSSLDVQVSSLHGHVLALENQTTALKESDLAFCKGTNQTISSINRDLNDFGGALTLQIRTDQMLITELTKERPANYSAMVLSLSRQVGQDGNMSFQLAVLAFVTQQNNFYGPNSDFCSVASK